MRLTKPTKRSLCIVHSALCIAVAGMAAARDITGLSVDANAGTATVTCAAGNAGETNAVYYVWTLDGVDKGANIAAWPNLVRLGIVGDMETSRLFELPDVAFPSGQYAARAFLADSARDFDYLVTATKSTGTAAGAATCYINTGFNPVGNKTVCIVDCMMNSTKGAQVLFGNCHFTTSTDLSYCAYVNGTSNSGGKWSFMCGNGSGSGKATTLTVSSSSRVVVKLDSRASKGGTVTVKSSGTSYANANSFGTRSTATSNPMVLFARDTAGTVNQQALATVYSCIITNDGAEVRNFHPAVKRGIAGMWDSVGNQFYASAGSANFTAVGVNETYRVMDGETVFAVSPAWNLASGDYVTETPYVESQSLSFATGGSKSGVAPLVLTGSNDWGGTFTVNEGALIANFGQGLASTDNLVFNGGTYGLCTGDTFNWTIGNGGGETSLGTDAATSLGFTAYGNSFSVVVGGSAATPIEFGSASSMGFNPALFVLNDDWATDTVTLKNGIIGTSGDSSKPNLKIYSGAADSMVEGDVSGVNFHKLGAGRLALRGANNSFGNVYAQGGRLVIAPPEGVATCTLSMSGGLVNQTTTSSDVVISNAVITHAGSMNWWGTTKVTLVGCPATANDSEYWLVGNYNDSNTGTARLVLDGSTVRTKGFFYLGKANGTSGDLVMTNNSSLTVSLLHALKGTVNQYGGSVQINSANGDAGWLGQSGTFTYNLRGGSLSQANSDGGAGFSIGKGYSGTSTGYLYVYEGATFTANGGGVFLAKNNSGDRGYLYVQGGAMNMTREGAVLYVGYSGSGTAEVSNGGILNVQKGDIFAVPQSQNVAGRTGTLRITGGGTVKARRICSDAAGSTANLVLDGGNVVANVGSTTNGLIYGFTSAAVGVDGATIDTNGEDKEIAQSFAARSGQSAPTATTGTELAAIPAFTKVGGGRLSLTGANDWLCATCVSNGTLSVVSGALPATTLRLGGGVIDLGGASHSVANLVGSGVVSNGTLIVTGSVWPGVGDSGVLKIDSTASISLSTIGCAVNGDGTCGCLAVEGALNLADVVVVGENLGNRREDRSLIVARAGTLIGRPATVKVGGLVVSAGGGRLAIGVSPTVLTVR